jgi:high affinity sulfate transporter 1
VKHFLSIFDWLPKYSREWLRFDLIAGLTAAAVVIPKAVAYASIAGLPIQIGLYTAFIPMVIYALLGTSRQLSVSTTMVIAILTANQLEKVYNGNGAAELVIISSTLALLVGIFLIIAAFLRLGFLAYFISLPVLTGFKAGVGLIIVVDQIPKLIGIHIDKVGFFRDIFSIGQMLYGTHIPTLIMAATAIVLILGMTRILPHAHGQLIAIVLGILASMLLGFKNMGVELVGIIPAGIPSFSYPDLSLIKQLWPGALSIALMSFIESSSAGKAFTKHGDPYPDLNRELYALGAANMTGGFFQTMPAGGGFSQTAANSKAGARTQISELVTACLALATMLFLGPFVGFLPQAILAIVVISFTFSFLNPADFFSIRRVHKVEFWLAIVALSGVVLFGLLEGIVVAVAVSLITLIYQANHPPVYALGRKPGTDIFRPLETHPTYEVFPGLLIVRTEGRLTFASVPRTTEKFNELVKQYSPKIILLDLSAVPDIEYTALMEIDDAEEKLYNRGILLWLAALNPRAFKTIERSILGQRIGHERMFLNVEQAVEYYLEKSRKHNT